MRSSSVLPRGCDTAASHSTTPLAKPTAASLPAAKPANSVARVIATPAWLRTISAGVARSYSHRRLPSVASRPLMRPSPVRTTTMPSAICGALITSLETLVFQRNLPSSAKAASSPLSPPTSTRPSPAPTPAEMTKPLLARHTCLPLARSNLKISPLALAAYTASDVMAGRSTLLPAAPMSRCQRTSSAAVGLNSSSLAASLPNLSPPVEQAASPARSSSAAMRTIIFRFPAYPAWRFPTHPVSFGSGCGIDCWHPFYRMPAHKRRALLPSCPARSAHHP